MTTPLLSLQGITKRYPGVVANQDVSLTVMPGQAHAVLGENGAGKSTLMKIIYGSVKPDEGQVFFKGQPVSIRNPQEARKLGISMVFQHFSLFDTLTVAENVWLGLDKSLSLAEVTQRIVAKASEYGLDLEPERPVHTLSVGEMQRVEIIRALLTHGPLEPRQIVTLCRISSPSLAGILARMEDMGLITRERMAGDQRRVGDAADGHLVQCVQRPACVAVEQLGARVRLPRPGVGSGADAVARRQAGRWPAAIEQAADDAAAAALDGKDLGRVDGSAVPHRHEGRDRDRQPDRTCLRAAWLPRRPASAACDGRR